LAYLVFCYGNHKALVAGQEQLEQFYVIVKNLAKKTDFEISAMEPFSHQFVANFHVSVVVAVSLGIIAVSYLRYKSHNQ